MSTAEASLSGTVTDKSTGDPLSGISVTIFNDATNHKWTANTDSSGAYSIQSFPVGTYNIEVEGDDYNATVADDLSLPAGNTVRNFTMSKGSSAPTKLKITGTVMQGTDSVTVNGMTDVTQQGGPVSGATVTVTNPNTGAVLGTTTSDSNGNFSIEVAPEDTEISATKDGIEYATENLNEEEIVD